jgi:hypothetical protein
MKWLTSWHLGRAERALTQARLRREARDIEDDSYGGLLIEQLDEERRIERRIADLTRAMDPNRSPHGTCDTGSPARLPS